MANGKYEAYRPSHPLDYSASDLSTSDIEIKRKPDQGNILQYSPFSQEVWIFCMSQVSNSREAKHTYTYRQQTYTLTQSLILTNTRQQHDTDSSTFEEEQNEYQTRVILGIRIKV